VVELDLLRVICRIDDVGDREARGCSMGADDWPLQGLVVRRGDEVQAYVNWCPHAGHRLNLKPHDFTTADRSLLLCHSHGALFEPMTGFCVAGPCAGQSLRRVPVVVEAGCVLLATDVDPATLVPD
jgi:nitrite reductase/ring-hydroxylating ferredoxin subunit